MVKARRELVVLSAFLSGIGTILSFVSLGTTSWVVSDGEFTLGEPINDAYSSINYGLFGGTFKQVLGGTTSFELTGKYLNDYYGEALNRG